jgi:hypothetical protein
MTINSEDYEAGEALTTKEAIKWMADGGLCRARGAGHAPVFARDREGFYSVSKGSRYTASGEFPDSGNWAKAILKRNPISWEDAVRALLDGEHVWDKDGDEWIANESGFLVMTRGGVFAPGFRFDPSFGPFFLTTLPSEKPVEPPKPERRNVSREDAICAMVRDPEQHCWGINELRWNKENCRTEAFRKNGCTGWYACAMGGEQFYLDPPEAK